MHRAARCAGPRGATARGRRSRNEPGCPAAPADAAAAAAGSARRRRTRRRPLPSSKARPHRNARLEEEMGGGVGARFRRQLDCRARGKQDRTEIEGGGGAKPRRENGRPLQRPRPRRDQSHDLVVPGANPVCPQEGRRGHREERIDPVAGHGRKLDPQRAVVPDVDLGTPARAALDALLRADAHNPRTDLQRNPSLGRPLPQPHADAHGAAGEGRRERNDRVGELDLALERDSRGDLPPQRDVRGHQHQVARDTGQRDGSDHRHGEELAAGAAHQRGHRGDRARTGEQRDGEREDRHVLLLEALLRLLGGDARALRLGTQHLDRGEQEEHAAGHLECAQRDAEHLENQRSRDCESGEDEEGGDGGAARHVPPLLGWIVPRHGNEDGDGSHRVHDEEDRGEREQAEAEPLLDHCNRHRLFTFSGVYHRLLSGAHRGRYHRAVEEATYRDLVENASDIIYAHDLEGRFTWVNRACERVTGYTREETLRLRIWDLVVPEYRTVMEKDLSGEMQTFEVEVLAKDGRRIPLELKSRLVYRGQMPVGVQGIARDITDRRRAAEAMRESEERYALAALGSNDGLWDWNLRSNRIFFSGRWKEQIGARDSEVGDDPDDWFKRVHPDDREHLLGDLSLHLEGRAPHLEVEHRVRHLDGSWRWMLVRGAAVRDAAGKAYRVAGSQTDITARKQTEEKLLHDALHDGLTGLPNRSLFIDRLGQALAFQRRREDYRFAVLFLDIDRFKTVNERPGHTRRDVLLVQNAQRLRDDARPGDTVARLGGDEFALLLGDFTDPEEPVHTAGRVQEVLAAPYDLDGTEVFATASIGVAVGSRGYSQPEELLRDADTAMYHAKDLGRARHAG